MILRKIDGDKSISSIDSVKITIMLTVRITVTLMLMLTMGMTMMVMLRQFKWRQRPWSRGVKVWTRGDDGNDLEASGLSTRSIYNTVLFLFQITKKWLYAKMICLEWKYTVKVECTYQNAECYSKCRSKPTMSYHERTKKHDFNSTFNCVYYLKMDYPHHSETFVFEHTWLKSVWALGGLYNCASPRPRWWWRPLPTWWCMCSRRRRNKNSFSAAFGIHGLLRAKTVRCLRIVSKCVEAITPSLKNRNLLISRSLLPNLDIVL